ncbi:uncharacterized protein O3Q21_000178 isoform 1-T1 [Podargus strigoides]
MKMCKTIPMFILLFRGYLCNNTDGAASTTTSSYTLSPSSEVMQAPESGTPPHESDPDPEKHLSTLLVAGISISFVLLFILVITGVWYAWKKNKGNSADINSIPSGERAVSLKTISTHEIQ